MNKKTQMSIYLITIIVTILSFLVILVFFKNINDTISTNTEDNLCRALVATKEQSKLGMGFFMYELENKCKVDEIKVDLSKKEEAFKKIGDEQIRCWERYGGGEYDFLSNFGTQGNWCFLCGVVEYKDNTESINYREYVEWTLKNYPDSLKDKQKISYFNRTNLLYTDVNDEEITNMRQEFVSLVEEDKEIQGYEKILFNALANNLESLVDLKTRQLNSQDEKAYVVYRFDRIKKDEKPSIEETGKYAVGGAIASVGTTLVLEGVTEAILVGGVSAGGCAATVVLAPLAPVCALVGGGVSLIKKTVSGTVKSVKALNRIKKINLLTNKIKSFYKKKGLVSNIIKIKLGKKAFSAYKKVDDFAATSKDLRNFAKGLRVDKQEKLAKNFETLADRMDEVGVNNLKDFDKIIITNKATIQKLEDVMNKDDEAMLSLYKEWRLLGKDTKELDSLRRSVTDEITSLKAGTQVQLKAGAYLTKLKVMAVTGTLGGAVYGYNFNGNDQQYVDMLTREQYYRLCGTQRAISN